MPSFSACSTICAPDISVTEISENGVFARKQTGEAIELLDQQRLVDRLLRRAQA